MIAPWVAYVLLVGTLLAGAAHLLDAALRLVRRPARGVWAGALALLGALVLLAPVRTAPRRAAGLDLPTAAVVAVRERRPAPPAAGPLAVVARARAAVGAAANGAAAALERRVPAGAAAPLGAAWLALSALVLALLAGVHYRLHRAMGRWPAADVQGVRVRLAPHAGPAVIGLARPEIVVPGWLLGLGTSEQWLVLAHEREHVRARDPLLLAAGWAAAALVPWHPAVWWMLSRLRLAVELDCDARVLARGAAPASYGALLIDLAGHGSGFRVGAPALADDASHLERRLRTMTTHRARFAPARTGALGALGLLALLAACEAKLPTETEVANMNVASAEQGLRRMAFVMPNDSTASYTLDGQTISAAQARALSSEQIGQIQVMRKRVDGGAGSTQINIVSRKPGDAPLRTTLPAGGGTRIVVRELRDSAGATIAGHGPGDALQADFAGLLVIDGVRAEPSRLRSLSPDQIVSIDVLKGPAAAKQYTDPAAARGVIRITTKAGATK